MQRVLGTTCTILIMLSLSMPASAEDASTTPQVEMVSFKLRILEVLPGTKPKTLAEPTIMTVTGREIRFVSGGEMKSKFDETKHELGTQIAAMIEPHKTDSYKLKLHVTLGNLKLPDEEPETELFIQQKLTGRTIVEAGKTKKIAISPSRWLEITIEKPTAQIGPAVADTVRYEELHQVPPQVAKSVPMSE